MPADDASSAEMRRSPAKPDADPLALDDETVERLLTGELSPAQAPPAYAEVAALLAAMAAPPSPEELSGQAATLAELRKTTRPGRAAAGTRRATRPPRRRLGLAAVVLAGALATGGAAAAATGHIPAPVREAARGILAPLGDGTPPAPPAEPGSPPDPVATGGPTSAGPATSSQGSRSTGTTRRESASTVPGSAAGLDNKGLCQAYLASKDAEPGKKLESSAFQALARAAGGEDKIAGYCAELLSDEAKPKGGNNGQPEPGGQGQGQGGPPPSSGPGNQDERAPGAPGR
jgi:hypothetical protein